MYVSINPIRQSKTPLISHAQPLNRDNTKCANGNVGVYFKARV
jgi:hypothetical protein